MPDFRPGRVAGAAFTGELGMPHGQQQFEVVCWLRTKTGPSKVGDAVTRPRPWTTSGRLPVALARRACLTSLLVGILDTWPN